MATIRSAKTKTLQVVDKTVLITDEIMQAFTELTAPRAQVKAASETLKATQDSELGTREKILVRLAAFSVTHNCSVDFIKDAADKALLKATNGLKDNTLNTFSGQCQRAMHPLAREHVASVVATAGKAWKAEVDKADATRKANDDAKAKAQKAGKPFTPVKLDKTLEQAFGKRYHLIGGMLDAHIKGVPDASDPVAVAHWRVSSRREDPQEALRAIKRLITALEAMHAEFPANEIGQMVRFAKAIKEKPEILTSAKAAKQLAAQNAITAVVPAVTPAAPASKQTRKQRRANNAARVMGTQAPRDVLEALNNVIPE